MTWRRFDLAVADPVMVAEPAVEIHVGTDMTVFHDIVSSAPLESQVPDVVDVTLREAGSVSPGKAHVAVTTGPLVPGTVDVQARKLRRPGIFHGQGMPSGKADRYILDADIFDRAMNQKWPAA